MGKILWEYKFLECVDCHPNAFSNNECPKIKELGLIGWEFVEMIHYPETGLSSYHCVCILKRLL